MRERRLLFSNEVRSREKWQRRGAWCYRISFVLLIVLLLLAAATDGYPLLPQPYFSFVKQWMGTGVAIALLFGVGGLIFSRDS